MRTLVALECFVALLAVSAGARAQDDEPIFEDRPPEPPGGWIEVRSVEGPLSVADARRGAAASRRALRRCAEARARGPETMTAEGVDFELVVGPDGRVRRVDLPELDPDERTPHVLRWRRCASQALRTLRFATAGGPSTVRASLVWSRGDPGGGGHGWRVRP